MRWTESSHCISHDVRLRKTAESSVQVLRKLPHLASCSLKGCPIADGPSYEQQMQTLLPSLQILDGRKGSGSRSQQAPGQRSPGTEPGKLQKRRADIAELDPEAGAGERSASRKAAKRRQKQPAERQKEALMKAEKTLGADQTGLWHPTGALSDVNHMPFKQGSLLQLSHLFDKASSESSHSLHCRAHQTKQAFSRSQCGSLATLDSNRHHRTATL